MTSEVENIMNGQVVGNVNAGKAIGVSTANLMPDGKGEVPLSKQTSFQIESSTMTQNPSLVTEELDLTPPSTGLSEQSSPVVSVPPVASVTSDTISDSPVDVVAPTQLGGLDINSIIPNIPFVPDENDNKTEIVETAADKNVELPEMPETILAEEPAGINDSLFVNLQNSPSPVSTVGVGEIKEVVPQTEDLEQDALQFGSVAPKNIDVSATPFISEVQEKSSQEVSMSQDIPSVVSSVNVQNDALGMPALDANAGLEKNNQEVQDEKDKKLDMILNKLDEISRTLKNTNEKIDSMREKNTKQVESPVLPQELTPSVNSTVPMAETVTEKQDEMVGALSQLGNMDGLTVDETPIKGGMFI